MEPENKDDDIDYVMEFDRRYTNNHIQILKAVYSCVESIPYIPVMIKYLELKQTIKMLNEPPGIVASEKQGFSPDKLYKAVKPYLSASEDQSCQQLLSLFHTIDQAKEMKQMMELFSPSSENTNENFDLDEMLKLISKEYNL